MTNLIYDVKIVNTLFVFFPFTSYVKLQQAYVSEAATNFGDWTIIGYKAPGDNNKTTNFTYAQPAGVTYINNSAALSTTAASVWQASNNSKLNDCPAAANWTLSIAASTTTAGEVVFTPGFLAANKTNCLPLTPNFESVGK